MKIQRVIPVSDQLRDILLDRIQSGTYPAGERFPSEAELCQEFGLSRASVRTALTELEARGLLIRQSGVGTFVAGMRRLESGLEQLESVLSIARRQGADAEVSDLHVSRVSAGEELAARLDLPTGEPLARVSRVIVVRGTPVSYHVDYLPAHIASPEQLSACQGSVLDFLAGELGLPVSTAQTEITAVTADTELGRRLGIHPATAVILLRETLYEDAADRPLGYSENYFVPDRFRLQLYRRKLG